MPTRLFAASVAEYVIIHRCLLCIGLVGLEAIFFDREPSGDACTEKMRRLVKLHGIGAEFATALTREAFYRPFKIAGKSPAMSA